MRADNFLNKNLKYFYYFQNDEVQKSNYPGPKLPFFVGDEVEEN